MDSFINFIEKAGFTVAIIASGYFGYIKEYGAATLFILWGISLILLMIIDFDDGEDFYV